MKFTTTITATLLVMGCDNTTRGLETDAEEAVATAVHHAQAAREELDDAKRGAGNELDAFVAKTNVQLDALAAKIDRLGKRAEEAPAQTRQALKEQAAVLEAREQQLKAKAQSLNQRANSGWETAKQELSDAVGELGRDIDQGLDQLGDDVREATE